VPNFFSLRSRRALPTTPPRLPFFADQRRRKVADGGETGGAGDLRMHLEAGGVADLLAQLDVVGDRRDPVAMSEARSFSPLNA